MKGEFNYKHFIRFYTYVFIYRTILLKFLEQFCVLVVCTFQNFKNCASPKVYFKTKSVQNRVEKWFKSALE